MAGSVLRQARSADAAPCLSPRSPSSSPRLKFAAALAGSVFLNGTKVDGLANTKIDKCSVEFDAKANVLLNCPGYAVKVEGAGTATTLKDEQAAVPGVMTRRYFLVTEQAQQGATDYDIEMYVNAKFIRRLKSDDEQIVTEITKHLSPGKNSVTFIAKKRTGAARKSFSPEHFFRVIVGEGNASGDRVMIDNPLVTFSRNAAETQDATEEFTLTTR